MKLLERIKKVLKAHPLQFYAIAGYYSTLDSGLGKIGNISDVAQHVVRALPAVVQNPVAVTTIAAPAAVTTVVAAATSAVGTASLGVGINTFGMMAVNSISTLFISKKKTKFGVVYDASTQKPVPGAIVQLYDNKSKRHVASAATKKDGRYIFSMKSGEYIIKVIKPGFAFPSKLANIDKISTANYLGQVITVSTDNPSINYYIPVDPDINGLLKVGSFVKVFGSAYLRYILFLAGTGMAVYSLVLKPSMTGYVSALVFMLLWVIELFHFDRSVLHSKIIDSRSYKSVGLAVVRVMDENGKSVETFVSDQFGQVLPKVSGEGQRIVIEKAGYLPLEFLPPRKGLIQRQKFFIVKL